MTYRADAIYYQDDLVTLYCGDALELFSPGHLRPHAVVTDPPYGMAFKSSRAGYFGLSEIQGDESTAARDIILNRWSDRPALVFGRWSVERPEFTRMVLTWEKGEHVGMGDLSLPWKPNTEEIYVLGKGFVGRRMGSVLRHLAVAGCVGRNNTGARNHPTEKPIGLMQALIDKCPPEWVICDPFAGSGSTLVAAKQLGRRAIGIELDEDYCATAAARLAQDTLFGGAA